MRPKEKGERTEAIVLAELAKRGLPVLLPFGDNQRYDFVVDRGGQFVRLQCKTGRLRDGAVEFSCTSTYQTYGQVKRRTDYRGQIDAFVVYCYETDEVYLVSVEAAGRSKCRLRVAPALNGQARKVRRAADHRLDAQWPTIIEPLPLERLSGAQANLESPALTLELLPRGADRSGDTGGLAGSEAGT